jgi:putative membrane protein insertion efficiency factor
MNGGKRKTDVLRQWSSLSWPMRLVAAPIYFYRVFLSPLWPHICRFEPSCSAYALDALANHGLIRGGWMTIKRLARCHPFKSLGGGEGYDPVPSRCETSKKVAAGDDG